MKTLEQLFQQSGSWFNAYQVCEEMIQELKKRLSMLKVSYHKIDQYKQELYNWHVLRLNCKNQITLQQQAIY